MTGEEYRYHRRVAVPVGNFGLCSVMKDGRIKMEGYKPKTIEQLSATHFRPVLVALGLAPAGTP